MLDEHPMPAQAARYFLAGSTRRLCLLACFPRQNIDLLIIYRWDISVGYAYVISRCLYALQSLAWERRSHASFTVWMNFNSIWMKLISSICHLLLLLLFTIVAHWRQTLNVFIHTCHFNVCCLSKYFSRWQDIFFKISKLYWGLYNIGRFKH